MMHQVGTQYRFLSPATEPHECQAGCVAGRWLKCDVARKHMLVANEVHLPGLEDRQDTVGDVIAGARECRWFSLAPIVHSRCAIRYRALGKVGTQQPFSSRVFQPT